jgi:hypothetical protein
MKFSQYGDSCSICYDELTPANTYELRKCKHAFHNTCLLQMRAYSNNQFILCPMCRMKSFKNEYIPPPPPPPPAAAVPAPPAEVEHIDLTGDDDDVLPRVHRVRRTMRRPHPTFGRVHPRVLLQNALLNDDDPLLA